MATPGERFKGWIEGLSESWKEKLKGWMASWLSFGIVIFMDVLGEAFAPKLKPMIESLERSEEVPPEVQPLLDELKSPTGQTGAMLGSALGYSVIGGAIGKILDSMFNPLGYWMYRTNPSLQPDFAQTMAMWLKEQISDDVLPYYIESQGFHKDWIPRLKELVQVRLDPGTITRIWLRDKAKYEKFWEDLKHQGWTPDRIEVAKELAKIIPPLADMVRFADFSAFDPEVIAAFPEAWRVPSEVRNAFNLIGVEGDWVNRYWFSHWIQPGRFELGEMHRRDIIDDDAVKLAYRTMGYSEYWRDKLLELVKAIPTRVDVRRWWDMRTIDEARLREIYHALGYYDKDLDDYILWTKVYVAFPDLMARFKNGWITEADVRSELTALGMPPERLEEMLQTKIKKAAPERVEKERDLTKSEIYAGVKKGVITWGEGIELLLDLGYDEKEAEFILKIRVGVAEGSPDTYSEFKDWTGRYRKAIGLETKIPSPELIEAERALREAEAKLERLRGEGVKEEKLVPQLKAKDDAAYRYKQLLTQWREKK